MVVKVKNEVISNLLRAKIFDRRPNLTAYLPARLEIFYFHILLKMSEYVITLTTNNRITDAMKIFICLNLRHK